MFQAPFPQLLRVGGLAWLLLGGLSAGFMILLDGQVGLSDWFWKTTLTLSLATSAVFFLASLVFKVAPPSVLWRMTFTGVLLCPSIVLFGTLGLAYLATTSGSRRIWLLLLIVSITVYWCSTALASYKQRMVDKRFIEREFFIDDSQIIVRQPLKTNLDPTPVNDLELSLPARAWRRAGPYFVMGIPLAYPIQRLFSDSGGDAAVLFLLSLLGLPITIYFLGRMTCGAYLWIYKVWQMQRRYGKPVVFDTPD